VLCKGAPSGGGGVTLAIKVGNIDAIRRHMEAIGLKSTAITKHPWDAKVFYLFDPEGHSIELWGILQLLSILSLSGQIRVHQRHILCSLNSAERLEMR